MQKKTIVIAASAALLLAAAAAWWWKRPSNDAPAYREVSVTRARIEVLVQSTGTVQPRNRIDFHSVTTKRERNAPAFWKRAEQILERLGGYCAAIDETTVGLATSPVSLESSRQAHYVLVDGTSVPDDAASAGAAGVRSAAAASAVGAAF